MLINARRVRRLSALVTAVSAVAISSAAIAQTTYVWRSEATNGNWSDANNWWRGFTETPAGNEILRFDNAVQLNMTNNLVNTSRHRIFFDPGSGARVIDGVTENTFFDFGGNAPIIQNDSSNLQTLNFPIRIGHTFMEINPTNAGITIGGNLNTNGNQLRVWGNNGHTLSFSGSSIISGAGSVAVNQNSVLSYNSAHSYSGDTFINAGRLDMNAGSSIANSQIQLGDTAGTVGAEFRLTQNGGYDFNRPITVRSGSSGIKTISSTNTTGTNTLSGGITLNDSLAFSVAPGGELSVSSLTFTSTMPTGGVAVTGSGITLTGGITNSNTTAGREVTINSNIVVSGAQTWSASNANAITNIAGNLSGADNLAVTGSAGTLTAPASVRLSGSNSAYTGSIAVTGGIALANPSAMIGGNVDLLNANNRMWIQGLGTAAANTYTFGVGTGAGNVNFRDSGGSSGGIGVYGASDALWRIGGGGNAVWADLRLEMAPTGSTGTRPWLIWGAVGDQLSFGASRTILSQTDANPLRIDYSLNPTAAANLTTSGGGLVVFNGGVATGTLTGTTTVGGGALAISNVDQIFNGNLNLSGGALVLNGVTWAQFAADRTTYGTGANQWQVGASGGFAARGTAVTIDDTGTTASTFDRNFTLGSAVRDASGDFYANTSVTIARDTTLSTRRTISVAATGPGVATPGGTVYTISGNLSDTWNPDTSEGTRGAVAVSLSGTSSASLSGGLVLAGTNNWQGSSFTNIDNNLYLNTGPGGMLIAKNDVIVRFDGDASLPSGNGVASAYIAALHRNATGERFGYMLTGTPSGETYTLPTGMKFLIGGQIAGIFGSEGGAASLTGSSISIPNKDVGVTQSLAVLVRDGSLTLGGNASPVRIEASALSGVQSDGGIAGAATPLQNSSATRTLVKRGEGTLVLSNVEYLNNDGSSYTNSFIWQIGRGSNPSSVTTVQFDGAIRETATTGSGSLSGFVYRLYGGVLEIDHAVYGSTFAKNANNSATPAAGTISWGLGGGTNGSTVGGGGFAAIDTDLTNNGGVAEDVTVTITNGTTGTTDILGWNGTPPGITWPADASRVGTGAPLMFGSRTGNAAVLLNNRISLGSSGSGSSPRAIQVIADLNPDKAEVDILGSVHGGSNNPLYKIGDGTLVLSNSNNVYTGATEVFGGTLLVNGTLGTAPNGVTVHAGAKLGGNGTINRAVSVNAGGTIAPGTSIGTLTVGSLTLASTAVYEVEVGASSADQLITTGESGTVVSLGGATLTLVAAGVSGSGGTYLIIDQNATAGAVDGTFANSSGVFAGIWNYVVHYNVDNSLVAASGNDVYLSVSPVPEPASLGLLAMASVGLLRRRRA